MIPAARALAAVPIALALAGCAQSPTEFAAALPSQDPKYYSPQCVEMRSAAATLENGKRQPLSWGAGALLGPYGLALAAAGKEHRAKQRKRFARDLHLACSSSPLPRDLVVAEELPPPPGTVVR